MRGETLLGVPGTGIMWSPLRPARPGLRENSLAVTLDSSSGVSTRSGPAAPLASAAAANAWKF